jgi:hypothetical protein
MQGKAGREERTLLARLPQLAAVFCNFEQFWRRK